MFDRVLVGYDGSAPARRACQVASEIAARFHSVLTVIVVRPVSHTGADHYLESLVPLGDSGIPLSALIDEVRGRAVAHGAQRVESVFLQGEVPEALLDWLRTNPQDLVVVGSRGLSRGRRLLLGSVSSGLVAEAPCPVLVVRPTRDHHADSGEGRIQ
ncbi:MAG TPA: universal stress protein [Thermoplasmata archaeon]|nr:universal stress protein [Thermoplasmata archaeon]